MDNRTCGNRAVGFQCPGKSANGPASRRHRIGPAALRHHKPERRALPSREEESFGLFSRRRRAERFLPRSHGDENGGDLLWRNRTHRRGILLLEWTTNIHPANRESLRQAFVRQGG